MVGLHLLTYIQTLSHFQDKHLKHFFEVSYAKLKTVSQKFQNSKLKFVMEWGSDQCLIVRTGAQVNSWLKPYQSQCSNTCYSASIEPV